MTHCNGVIMGTMAPQITSLTIVRSTVDSDADQSKHQSSASMAFVRGIHRGPVNSPHKWPVTHKIFPFDDVIMQSQRYYFYPCFPGIYPSIIQRVLTQTGLSIDIYYLYSLYARYRKTWKQPDCMFKFYIHLKFDRFVSSRLGMDARERSEQWNLSKSKSVDLQISQNPIVHALSLNTRGPVTLCCRCNSMTDDMAGKHYHANVITAPIPHPLLQELHVRREESLHQVC